MSRPTHYAGTPVQSLNPQSILLIDDEEGIRDSLSMFLQNKGFVVVPAETGEAAMMLLKQQQFDLIITDISMPGNEGGLQILETVRDLYSDTEVIMMTGHLDVDFAIQALKLGAFDYFKKPFLFEEIYHATQRALERRMLLGKARDLERMKSREEATAELHTQFMISLASIIDAKSRFTRTHSERVSGYARYLGIELGLSNKELRRVTIGGKLHDIGKIGTPESILNKPAKLDAEERAIIEQHPVCGADLIKPISFMKPYLPIVRSHHENLDGTGYPDGLSGEEIPLEVFTVKIADYYDAITSHRPYRDPMSLREACSTLQGEIGRAFPEDLVHAFIRTIEKAPWEKDLKKKKVRESTSTAV